MMMADRSSGSRCLLFDKLRARLKTITMMKKLLLFLMMLAFVLPAAMAGEKTIVINRNEGIYEDGTGVYYCTKGGITMTFSSGLNNVNYLVEHQQVVFDIFSTNYVIKKIKFNCLDNTTDDNLDCFYWGPSTISELGAVATYVPTGTYTWSGYIGTWVGGSTPSKYVKFVTEGKPVRFGSVEITIDKEFGDIYDLVTLNSEIEAGQTYALVSKYDSRALGKEEYHGSDAYTTFSSTPVTLLNFDQAQNNYMKVKVTDEVALMKLESSGNSNRPWYIKIGDNYMRRRTGTLSGSGGPANGQGYNLYTESSVPSDRAQYFRTNISVENNNNNALIRFEMFSSERPLGNETFAIRHYNGGDLFRVIDYNTSNNQYANNQRVYLYKPAQTYYVTTNCLPDDNSGYITLGDGVLSDGNGNYTSQQYDNVSFFVGPTDGWGIGTVTVTNLSTNEVTTLTPTASSDFGNDYEFQMPAANVNVTANFLAPYNIDTICNPADGGQFNFINGYTNFNGQHYSNAGKTVTFKPTAADGYSFTSVTFTDDVTGETTTMTPDANGVYSFVMPGNSVTLTANFEAAHDLYLLGTANGRTGWVPYGPKFTFDGVNEKYYIDVYFKGYNDDPNTDPAYGYFSLTKKISDPEHPNWDDLNGFRLAAETNQYWVADGYTGVPLYGDRPNNSFKIKPGVYRIEVNKEMTEMSIIEYPLTLTFDPAGGVPGNGVIVEPNTEVTISSNLQDLVHAINPNEDPVMFYNTIDNWATQENDNTRVISNIGETTVTGSAALGDYLIVNGAATYEIPGNLYLLGTANGNTVWYPHGPQFNFDEVNQEYYIDVYFKGDPTYNNNQGDPYGHFSLTTKISASDDGWGEINGYRLFATQLDYMVEDGTVATNCFQTSTDYAFKIPAGVYRITVNKAMNTMTITEYPLSLTFDPVSGSTVVVGDNVTISSNLDQLVHNINPNEVNASFKNSTDGGNTWDLDNTAAITAAGATTTVNAEAWIDYIIVPGTATYTTLVPTVYDITTQVNPEGSNAGTISAPGGAEADVTVNFTVTDADPAVYTLTGVEVVDSNNGIVASFEPSADGNYSFTMPSDDVTIHADYERTKYDVTTSWSPSEGGAIWLNGVNTPQTISVPNADQVVFGVSPADGFELVSITVTNTATGQEITPEPTGNSNEYSFTMPTGDVTIMANFSELPSYDIHTIVTPDNGGTISVQSQALGGETVNFTVDANTGFDISSVTVTYGDGNTQTVEVTDNGDGTYSFVMPAEDVTVTANFSLKGEIFRLVTKTSEIVEGRTYIYVSQLEDKVMASASAGDLYGTADIIEWVTPDKWKVKVDGSAAFFKPYLLVDTLFGNITRKACYLKAHDGCFLEYDTNTGRIKASATMPTRAYGRLMMGVGHRSHSYGGLYYYLFSRYNISSYDMTFEEGTFGFHDNSIEHYNYISLYILSQSYNIFSDCTGSGHLEYSGQVTGTTAIDGDTVIVTPVAGSGYAFDDVTGITVTMNDTGETVEVTDNEDGTFTFVMPIGDVTVSAAFVTGYTITTICDPDAGGRFEGILYPSAYEGQTINYSVIPNDNYVLESVTYVYEDSGNEESADFLMNEPENGNRTFGFEFVMPAENVTIIAHFVPAHHVTCVVEPISSAGQIVTSHDTDFGTVQDSYFAYEDYVYLDVSQNAGYLLDHVTVTRDDNGQSVTLLNPFYDEEMGAYYCDFVMPDADVTVTAYFSVNTPLSFIEYPGTMNDGDEVEVTDELIGTWVAQKYLWAKDQAPYVSNFYSEINPESEYIIHDYHREYFKLQHRDWDQSNWVMLDFSTIPELAGYSQQQLMAVMNNYVDNKIVAGSIKGSYRCVTSNQDPFGVYQDQSIKVQHVIELSELPQYVKDPATIGPNNTLGYPGFQNDPLETAGKYYANPVANYAYNHYSPANFLILNLTPDGVEGFDTSGEFSHEGDDGYLVSDHWFFMRPKDQEVVQVWAVWLGEKDYYDEFSDEERTDSVFVVYEWDPDEGYNSLAIGGAFRVGSWDYNINKTDDSGKPTGYGPPTGELRKDFDYTFHAAIQYTPYNPSEPDKKVPSKAPMAANDDPGFFNVYPLDMTSPDETYTGVKEVASRDATTIVDIRYYNIMGQESMTPFDGINIMVIRYKDGSFISKKILK